MLKNLLPCLLILLVLLLSVTNVHANESIEWKLASIDAGKHVSENDISIVRFRTLLNQLSTTFIEEKQQIGDMSVTVQNLLKRDGVQESLRNIMEGINQLFGRKIANQKYAEYVAAYATLRGSGKGHIEAIRGLKAILRSVGN